MSGHKNKISVVFRISGSAADVVALSLSLGEHGGAVVLRPENVPDDALPQAWWAVEVTLTDQESTENCIVDVLGKLEPVGGVILAAYDSKFRVELDCTVEINEERPEIEILPQTLRRLAQLNAALSFEVYDNRE